MILECSNIQKGYQGTPVLKDITFKVEDTDKIAIIGVNGAGKTTILKIINNEEEYDAGNIFKNKNVTIGYLTQQHSLDSQKTVRETGLEALSEVINIEKRLRELEVKMQEDHFKEVLDTYDTLTIRFQEMGGFSYPSKLTGVLKGLGFSEEEFDFKVSILSGGQKTRLSLARLLLQEPTLLLLDEPTNHLDSSAIHFLENYLKNYPHAIITVSHDRYFIDQVSNKIIEIEHGKSKTYQCKYQTYAETKQKQRAVDLKHYVNQQKELQRIQKSIDLLKSYNKEKTVKRAESKEKQLDKIEKIERPENLPDTISLQFKPARETGFNILKVEEGMVAFEEPLFQHITIDIKKQERVALVGDNGVGKTTLFKAILDPERLTSGKIEFGSKIDIAYYDQEHSTLSLNKDIFREISDTYPRMNNTEIRSTLAMFNFTADDVFKEISTLSGGERARVVLTKILLQQGNFLLLDEPTNHLDIPSKEVLEEALLQFSGTIFFISHDRYFINKIATRIIELTPNSAISYDGNYELYAENKYHAVSTTKQKDSAIYQDQKQKQATLRKQRNAIKKVEAKISNIEITINSLRQQLSEEAIINDYVKYNEIQQTIDKQELELEQYLEEWETMQE